MKRLVRMNNTITVKYIKTGDVKVNPKNRNQHAYDQIDRLIKIIEYQGFRNPIIISNRTGLLVAGHGRLMAAKKMKLKEIPAMFQDFKDEAQEYAAMVSDNAIAEWSLLDLSGINSDLPDLGPDFDINMLGLKNFVLDMEETSFDPSDSSEEDKPHKVCPHCGEDL
jgi:ParB-like nuclease family protein